MRLAVISVLFTSLSVAPFARVTTHYPNAAPAPVPQAASRKNPAQTAAADRGWPRGYSLPNEAQLVIYQPQIASWQDQKHVVALAALSYVAKGEHKPALGTIKLEADTEVALEQRLVKFTSLKITETNFQTLGKEQAGEIAREIEKNLPDQDRVIALDRVLAYVDKSTINPKNVTGLKSDPPRIILTQTPSVLVSFDGDPIWSPIKDNELKFAVNTNWDIFQHQPTGLYYLRIDNTWLRATDLKGYWSPAGKLPDSFNKLPADDNWKDVRENLPGVHVKSVPKVYVTTDPTELIVINGEPKYEPVPNTGLLWISNSESDLFRMGKNGPVYFLVAGRWFSAPALGGQWTFATPTLPEDFKQISLEHPRSRVLASVPGTQQAAEAVLLAEIPQYARVNKKEITAPEVQYQGEPQYENIQGTQLQRAVNTDKEIIKFGEAYYMCYQGVWFTSNSPTGPWAAATSVPKEIYQIPPSSPSYSVTYVTVEDDDESDDWVTYAAYAGYSGLMIGWGCTVWGTGWYYPPYYWYGGYYPVYYPYWRTYGYGAWYNPYTGVYGTAGRIYGPYGGVGYGARYNPSTGTYARGAFAYGPYGARGAASAYNPRTGAYASTRQGSNVYGSWGSTTVQRGDDWVNTKRFTNSAGNTTRVTRGDEGGMISRRGQNGSGFVGSKGDNVYAGRDGNVYRRDANGNWQKWDNGSWNSPNRPEQRSDARDSMLNDRARAQERSDRARGDGVGNSSSSRGSQIDRGTMNSLERDRAARSTGSQRSRDYGNYSRSRSSSSGSSVGGYRGSSGGGGFRGGGGGGFRGGGRRR
jgi:hypothetical protein